MSTALAPLVLALCLQPGTGTPANINDLELERETAGFLRWLGIGGCQPDADFREQLIQLTEETRETHERLGLPLPKIRVRLQATEQRTRPRYTALITSDSKRYGRGQVQVKPATCALLQAEIFEALGGLLPQARGRVLYDDGGDQDDDLQTPDNEDNDETITPAEPPAPPLRAQANDLRLGVDAGSQLGPFPKPSVSVGLGTELGVARFVFESRLRFSAVRPDVAPHTPGTAVDNYQQYLFQASPCIALAEGLRVRLPLCVGVELGFLRATMSSGWRNRRRTTGFWAAATVGARLQLRSSPKSTAVAFGIEAWMTKPGALRWRSPAPSGDSQPQIWDQNPWIGGRGFIELSLRAHAWTRFRKVRRRRSQRAG